MEKQSKAKKKQLKLNGKKRAKLAESHSSQRNPNEMERRKKRKKKVIERIVIIFLILLYNNATCTSMLKLFHFIFMLFIFSSFFFATLASAFASNPSKSFHFK